MMRLYVPHTRYTAYKSTCTHPSWGSFPHFLFLLADIGWQLLCPVDIPDVPFPSLSMIYRYFCENIYMNWIKCYFFLQKVSCAVCSLGTFHIVKMGYLTRLLFFRNIFDIFLVFHPFLLLPSLLSFWVLLYQIPLFFWGYMIYFWYFHYIFNTLLSLVLFSVFSLHLLELAVSVSLTLDPYSISVVSTVS